MLEPVAAQAMAHPRQWQCIAGCGACCRLDPALRAEALEALDADQRRTYLSMVGPDGWCIHYDTGGRRCRVYDGRPDFCRVANLVALFAPELLPAGEPSGPPAAELAPDAWPAAARELAIHCCTAQIRSEYGGRGKVMRRFLRAVGRR